MAEIPKIDAIEMIRAIGEIKKQIEGMDSDFIQWVMRVGEARNILNNSLAEFRSVLSVMKELEHNIPQFHKQPGNFRELENHINHMIQVISKVNYALSYVQEPQEKEIINDEESEYDE